MGKIVKGIIFGGKARVAVIDIKDIVNEEIALHNMSPLAAAALGRAMTAGAYISNNLKSAGATFSVTINGNGPLGGIVVAGNGENVIRGYVGNPDIELPLNSNSHLDVGGAVGTDGYITVIKDLGLKDPYVGRCQLISGEIAEDFTKYLYSSEGIRSAVALGVRVDKAGCVSAGGVIVEALPDIEEPMLFMLEDIMTNFVNVSEVLAEKSAEEIFDFYFGHLNSEVFPVEEVMLRCTCSEERTKKTLRALGKKECEEILEEVGKVEMVCPFCDTKYNFSREEIERLWDK